MCERRVRTGAGGSPASVGPRSDKLNMLASYCYKSKYFFGLVRVWGLEERLIAGVALPCTLLRLHGAHDLRALLLEKLAEGIVVLEGDPVVLHDVVVQKLDGRLNSEASTVGHTESLRHFIIRSEFNSVVGRRAHP
jgi:hypothetical protein